MAYHINPETGRPNICRASVRDCRFGSASQHFESKAAAQASSEKNLSEEFGVVHTLKKLSKDSEDTPRRSIEEISKELGVVTTEKLHALVKKRLRLSMTPREIEKFLEDEGGYDSAPFYVYYNGNQEVALDYNHHSTAHTFTRGACAFLASELNRVTGFPMAVFTDEKMSKVSWSGHVAIKLPNGDYLDVEGVKDSSSIGLGFPGSHLWIETDVSHEEFKKIMDAEDRERVTDGLPPLEKAVLAKVCLDLISDYSLDDPDRAGEMRF